MPCGLRQLATLIIEADENLLEKFRKRQQTEITTPEGPLLRNEASHASDSHGVTGSVDDAMPTFSLETDHNDGSTESDQAV